MDWRDSNIVLGEQMNTRGYDSSRLLASHKGVGILRPDGQTQAGAEVLALTVRTDYMPNQDWQTICQRGRTLREAEDTLTGHAAGEHSDDPTPEPDHAAAVRAIGAGMARRHDPRACRNPWPPSLITSTDSAQTSQSSSRPPNSPRYSTSIQPGTAAAIR